MLTIGDFSRLCMVTTKTLRHYDAIGLLKPAQLDAATGYRYYEVSQLTDMLLILKLKEYGFSLETIGEMIELEDKALMPFLEEKLAEQTENLRVQRRLVKQLRKDIERIKKGKDIMKNNIDVKIVERQPQQILSVRDIIAISDFDKMFAAVGEKLKQAGVQPVGAPMAIYYSEDFNPASSDIELAWPVAPGTKDSRMMAGGRCATTMHKGTYSKLNASYAGIVEWIEANGYNIAGAPFEVYLNDPKDTPEDDLMTELFFPIGTR